QEPDVTLAPEPVARDQPRLHDGGRRVQLSLRFLRALLGQREALRGRAEPDLGRAKRARLHLDLALQIRQPPEHRRLAAGELLGRLPLRREPLLQLGQRLGDRGGDQERDHVLRNRATAIQLPANPTRPPAAKIAAACRARRCGAPMPVAKAKACVAYGSSQCCAESTAATATPAPSRPCKAPSRRNGART